MTKIDFYLTQLASECVETAHEITKALQFGLDDINPKTGEKNRDAIVREYLDVVGSMEALISERIIPEIASSGLAESRRARIEKTARMYVYSQSNAKMSRPSWCKLTECKGKPACPKCVIMRGEV